MDSCKLKISRKVQASTLVEVLVAMVTIVVVFGIAMMIYSNVMRSSVSVKKVRAQSILNGLIQETQFSAAPLRDDSFSFDDLRVDQTVKTYQEDKNLAEIDLAAYDSNNQLLATLKKVIIARP